MICATCSDILQRGKHLVTRNENRGLQFLHHAHVTQLQAAARASCYFCTPLWRQFSAWQRAALLEADSSHVGHIPAEAMPDPGDECVQAGQIREQALENYATICLVSPYVPWFGDGFEDNLVFSIRVNEKRRERLGPLLTTYLICAIYFPLIPVDRQEARSMARDRPEADLSLPARQTGSAESWALAKAWLDRCLTSHARCNRHRDVSWYPTRLLELSRTDGTFKIIETDHAVCTGPYMTLSHRWGPSQPRVLNRSTYATLHTGMPVSELPQIFQDAIAICRRLDVRYIWIDCLCIMQDREDLSDWNREALLMHKVYTHSYLNISALRCPDFRDPKGDYDFVRTRDPALMYPDADPGLFATRDPNLIGEQHVKTRIQGLHVGDVEREYHVIYLQYWANEVQHATLNLRAWVLQERLLAPRILHFGHRQLFWECHELEASECSPHGLHAIVLRKLKGWSKRLTPAALVDGMHTTHLRIAPEHAPYHYWARIVHSFSKCKLTESSDKLVALAGVAKYMMAEHFDDEYVAGMWRRHLPFELTWAMVGAAQADRPRRRRASPYRAPTFSWASVDGIIEPGVPDDDRMMIEVVDVTLDHATDDATGMIRGGWLTLRCRLQQVSLRPRSPSSDEYGVTVNGEDAVEYEGEFMESGESRLLPLLDEHETYLDPTAQPDGTLFCAPARENPDGSIFQSLLLRLARADTGTYERLGLLDHRLDPPISPATSHIRAVLQSHSPREHLFPCASYSPATHLHTIHIL